MASHRALAFLLAATLLVASPLVMADKSFDFFFLILQWPGSYCAQRAGCCKPTTGLPAKDFFIRSFETHDDTTGEPVRRCNKLPLDVDALEGERAELQQYWSSIKCPSNNGVSFWKNVWKYYGVCSNMTESDYFGAALGVRAKVDLLSALADKGIVPSVVGVYSVESIRSAVKEALGVTPLVRCSQAPLFPGQFLLFEIYVCVDKDGKTLIECPVSPYFRCTDLVLFPPFEYDVLKDTTTAAAVDPSSQLGDSNPIRMPVSTQYY